LDRSESCRSSKSITEHLFRRNNRLILVTFATIGRKLMIHARRDIRRTLAYGIGAALLLAVTGLVFIPALAIAILGFLGVVLAAAVILARGTSRWLFVWVAAGAGALWLASIIAYWALWATAFDLVDDFKAVPAQIGAGSNAALAIGAAAFLVLVGTALGIQVRSKTLPKDPVATSASSVRAFPTTRL
jgi:hypothetical protein